jgi:16S rRNA C967 or C1407 C5-methylase (RsmB/RsmF family)
VYSTCSLNPVEDEAVIQRYVALQGQLMKETLSGPMIRIGTGTCVLDRIQIRPWTVNRIRVLSGKIYLPII